MIMGAADIRLAYDLRFLSEDLKPFLRWIWDLWTMFGSEEEFYRVAEGDSRGAFEHGDVRGGFAKLTEKERQGNYDWSLNFSDDAAVKEAKKQEALAWSQIMLQIPFVMQDQQAQYKIAGELCKVFGKDIAKFASMPPPAPIPLMPDEEWTRMLEGETVHVNPADDDAKHLDEHKQQLLGMSQQPQEDWDQDAMWKMNLHMGEHTQQQQQKIIAQQQQQAQMLSALAGLAGVGEAAGHPNPLQAIAGQLQGAGGQPGQPGGGMVPPGTGQPSAQPMQAQPPMQGA